MNPQIIIYETNGCYSCRKAKAWLENKGLPYIAVNMQNRGPSIEELKRLFNMSLSIEDIISFRSKPIINFKRLHGCELEDLSFNQLLEFLHKNPTAIRRPLITNGKVLVSGFDEDELTVLLPREMRDIYPGKATLSLSRLR